MKVTWFIKELAVVLTFLALSIISLIWAVIESSNLSHQYAVVAIGFTIGFIPMLSDIISTYRRGEFFLKDKNTIAARKARNAKQARLFFIPGIVLAITFGFFPGAIKVLLLSMIAGYLLPYSFALLFHFLKNHKEIERITRDIR